MLTDKCSFPDSFRRYIFLEETYVCAYNEGMSRP
jgi:hypothetical protein